MFHTLNEITRGACDAPLALWRCRMTRKRVSSNRRQRERIKEEIDRAMRPPAMPDEASRARRDPSAGDESAAQERQERRQ